MAFTKTVTIFFVFAVLSIVTADGRRRRYDPCEAAFRRCDFQFSRPGLQTFSIKGPADTAFTPDIVSKDPHKLIGVVNTNIEGEFILRNGRVVPFTKKIPRGSGVQPFMPTVFKAFFPSTDGMFSGIGHETFQKGQREFAKDMCVRVFLTEYQVLDRRTKQVIGNENKKRRGHNCVVFRTKGHDYRK